jgi:hypothetical protein
LVTDPFFSYQDSGQHFLITEGHLRCALKHLLLPYTFHLISHFIRCAGPVHPWHLISASRL